MPLVNALPLDRPAPWSATAPQQALELITTYNLDERDALMAPPNPDFAWSDRGSHTSVGVGIIKVAHVMPQSAQMQKFTNGNNRKYHGIDVVTKALKPGGLDLSYMIPMVWDDIGNGWKLMSQSPDGSLLEFVGINGLGALYVTSGKAQKCEFMADLFYSSLYATTGGLSITTPTKTTFTQGLSANGIALFSDGTGADGTVGAKHYANPVVSTSGRFANVFFAYGEFSVNYKRSLVQMTVNPNALFPNVTSGARVTDTFGGTAMRTKFWEMAVQSLVLQAIQIGGSAAAAAITNPYSYAATQGITEENFIGAAFGPRTFWIVPHLDNHQYLVQNPGADFWINVDARPGVATWAKLACNSKTWTPIFRMYGPGDPQAQRDRMMRWEGDLDGASEPGDPMRVQMFGSA